MVPYPAAAIQSRACILRAKGSLGLLIMLNENDPSSDQTPEMIKAHYAVCEIGTKAAIRNTHGGMLHFIETEIVHRGVRTVNVKHLPDSGGTAFYFDGRNFKFSRGQSTLVIWTPEIAEWNKRNPIGRRISRH